MTGIYNISSTAGFLPGLAKLLAEKLPEDELRRALVLLPSRRSCQKFAEIFNNEYRFKPIVKAIGDVDETFSDDANVVSSLEAGVIAADIISGIFKGRLPFEKAVALAASILTFLGELETYGQSLENLHSLHPEEYSQHWQDSMQLLSDFSARWQKSLEAQALQTFESRRNQYLLGTARQWRESPPDFPVIIAGSTGSIPATAELIKTVFQMPRGIIVLHGLDATPECRAWNGGLEAYHQYSLRMLLEKLGVAREAVISIDPQAAIDSGFMLPSACADEWVMRGGDDPYAHITCLKFENELRELKAIPHLIKKAALSNSHRIAVIATDKNLLHRISLQLRMDGLKHESSAGISLPETRAGNFALLAAIAFASGFSGLDMLAVLKHPLCHFGDGLYGDRSAYDFARFAEMNILRASKAYQNLGDIIRRLEHSGEDDEALSFFRALFDAASKKADIPQSTLESLNQFLQIMAGGDSSDSENLLLWNADGGAELQDALDELLMFKQTATLSRSALPGFLRKVLCSIVCSPAHDQEGGGGIFLLTPIEARLLAFDVVILAGMNDGNWPRTSSGDIWATNGMRETLGLPTIEHQAGLAAHDFVNALSSAKQVYITRSLKSGSALNTESRFLSRLALYAKIAYGSDIKNRDEALEVAEWLDYLHKPLQYTPAQEPLPSPPITARLAEIHATEVETLMRDPYEFYCSSILKLKPLDEVDSEADSRDFGIMIHELMASLARNFLTHSREEHLNILLEQAERGFHRLGYPPVLAVLWLPRIKRALEWALENEAARRSRYSKTYAEIKGAIDLSGFKLKARADRLDYNNAEIALVDYKTGTPPSLKDISTGKRPQILVEALIAEGGGFDATGTTNTHISELAFWKINGRDDGVVTELADSTVIRQLLADFKEHLPLMLEQFLRSDSAFYVANSGKPLASRYRHLERWEEWGIY